MMGVEVYFLGYIWIVLVVIGMFSLNIDGVCVFFFFLVLILNIC